MAARKWVSSAKRYRETACQSTCRQPGKAVQKSSWTPILKNRADMIDNGLAYAVP